MVALRLTGLTPSLPSSTCLAAHLLLGVLQMRLVQPVKETRHAASGMTQDWCDIKLPSACSSYHSAI